MPQGFYELLGLQPDASSAQVRAAYQRRLAELVRRLREARRQGADVSILEAQKRSLREAMEVLSEPARRRRYDAYRLAGRRGLPEDADALWSQVKGALVDPGVAAALEVVRVLTDLPLGDPLPAAPGDFRPGPVLPPVDDHDNPPPTEQSDGAPPPQVHAADPAGRAIRSGAGVRRATRTQGGAFDESPAPPRRAQSSRMASQGPAPPPGGLTPLPESEPIDDIDRLARRFGQDGRFLEAVRKLRGMDREELARRTRVALRYIEAIEANAYDRLPSAIYVRGYLKEIARVLEVADRGVVERYMVGFTRHRG